MSRHAARSDTDQWHGWTLGQLRAFLADTSQAADDTLLIAVTRWGTSALQGVGFFSLSSENDDHHRLDLGHRTPDAQTYAYGKTR